MAKEFKLPEVSEGVEAADIAEIKVSEGDTVNAGQVVFEVETEKAVADIEIPFDGKITKIHVSVGDSVPIGGTLLSVDEAGGDAGGDEEPKAESKKEEKEEEPAEESEATDEAEDEPEEDEEPEEKPAPTKKKSDDDSKEAAAKSKSSNGRNGDGAKKESSSSPTRSSQTVNRIAEDDHPSDIPPAPAGPATRRLARKLGVDLHQVKGSESGGRISTEDVQAFVRDRLSQSPAPAISGAVASPALPDFSKFGPVERTKMSKLARTSAANLARSWQLIPHVTQHDLADITELESARRMYMKSLGKNGPKITMTVIVVKAAVAALKAFPHFNSSIDLESGELIIKKHYHVGIAVDTENGLVVPVIRDADRKTIIELAAEVGDLAERARNRKLEMSDMQGGTFTITNLGGIGGTAFTPIVNYPEVAILGMSRSFKQLEWSEDGRPVDRLKLPLSLSYDHRVVNGADAARFIVKLSRSLADSFELLMEA